MVAGVGPVVVGTDFSEGSAMALREARGLAARTGSEIQVVHIVDGGTWRGWGDGGQAGEWLKSAGLELESLVVRYGSPWIELARYASEAEPLTLVLGSHGCSGYQSLSLGTTAARVSLCARCPVLLVPARSHSKGEAA